jgi:hypothetical protein
MRPFLSSSWPYGQERVIPDEVRNCGVHLP